MPLKKAHGRFPIGSTYWNPYGLYTNTNTGINTHGDCVYFLWPSKFICRSPKRAYIQSLLIRCVDSSSQTFHISVSNLSERGVLQTDALQRESILPIVRVNGTISKLLHKCMAVKMCVFETKVIGRWGCVAVFHTASCLQTESSGSSTLSQLFPELTYGKHLRKHT